MLSEQWESREYVVFNREKGGREHSWDLNPNHKGSMAENCKKASGTAVGGRLTSER